MKRSKWILYGLLILTVGSYNQCVAPENWTYKSKEYVVHKDLSSVIPLSSASPKTEALIITAGQIQNALGLKDQVDDAWFGERMKKTLKSVTVESCSIDINVSPGNEASIMYLQGTLTTFFGNKSVFNDNLPIPMSAVALYLLTEKLNKNAVADVQKAISDNLQNLNRTLNFAYTITPGPANKVAKAEIDIHLVVTAVYDVCQLMPPGSGGKDCQ